MQDLYHWLLSHSTPKNATNMIQTNHSLNNIRPSYIREILSAAKSPDVISLAGGLPTTGLIPTHLFSKALLSICERPADELCDLFQYGETRGYDPLLNEVRKYYSISPQINSIITNGSQQGLDLIARAFLNPKDGVVVEAPSYLGALQAFGLAQADIHSVQQTNSGPDLNKLEALFSAKKIKLFYAVPDFHNPTGVCWSLEVRQQVALLCQRYDVTLLEDAPYRELRFSGQDLPLASSFCEDQAIVLRSFSKIAAPGIRLGMVSALPALLTPMVKVKQAADLHTSIPMQDALMQVLKDAEFPQHIATIRSHYKQRYEKFKELLLSLNDSSFSGSGFNGSDCRFNEVEGGMFIWLQLPDINPLALAEVLLKNGVAVVPSNVFYHHDNNTPPALRLNFTHAAPEKLESAVLTIKKCLQEMM